MQNVTTNRDALNIRPGQAVDIMIVNKMTEDYVPRP
ncbi:hypothetical protein PIIN_11633 [Serendipita indica DSM 11827]|uniref:Uncharacterized protein n=1 Tax=Serendipita indica (strain DSM 11827) TaxID=1109443 RepID=G4U262_SERID|nr:hypothetical protein PIIN_11633 [Serendipita indica DSM 11827]